jgi:hypothetical protein
MFSEICILPEVSFKLLLVQVDQDPPLLLEYDWVSTVSMPNTQTPTSSQLIVPNEKSKVSIFELQLLEHNVVDVKLNQDG